MTEKELYTQIISKLPAEQTPDLLKSLLEEACENACNSKYPIDDKFKMHSAFNNLVALLSLSKAFLKASLEKADIVNLNYRGKSFQIDRNHQILQADLSGLL